MTTPLINLSHERLKQFGIMDGKQAITALEQGQILFFPEHAFPLGATEHQLLTHKLLKGSHKNVSFNYLKNQLGSFNPLPEHKDSSEHLHQFMRHFAEFAKALVDKVLPQYTNALRWGRTSYRPARIQNRNLSKRKDDTRLHVDSFPGTPVYGQRILRIFCNINPEQEPRVWHTGEPFHTVLKRFSNRLPRFNPFLARLLTLIKATKQTRSAYDHYMLKMHDTMKKDDDYQSSVKKERIEFPAQSTWMVFTDQVSHAALTGQYLLEQTFYLPVEAMINPELSPLKQWEKEKSI